MPDVSHHETVLLGLRNGIYSTLGVSLGSHRVTPGEKIDKKDTHPTPTLVAPLDLPPGAYTIICIDLDAPFISWNVLSPVAHWIQTGFKITHPDQELKSDEPAIAPWTAASPPPAAVPHRYVFFLYNQNPNSNIPLGLKEKPMGIMQRMRFDVDAMVKQLGLGDIVAANYFVSN
ncbi:hypothetical protein Asppvi_003858 [Aspergillus pseudoviridinutans]|uniref:Phosphatidylethanolamine-binding protein n=1 Tax=Aspergillus pseudoviridinutans TaxID=1517512 RepID=A0A9P3B977_9EURO|nr:uncharacterized protein Asppvi_003858 [Aspergillus pseudoviridinutans]GIJ85003.1 hypothetical protein Asppvi_003858 [Aspergillus pseudoviridinutans]